MGKYIIEGGRPLEGEITVAGNKNAALPIIVATALTDQDCRLENVPEIRDVHVMLGLLRHLGKKVVRLKANSYHISGSVNRPALDEELAGRIRASILFVSVLLARFGETVFPPPGGCVIGRRKIDSHHEVIEAFGGKLIFEDDVYRATLARPAAARIFLKEASVTATENAMLLAAAIPGRSVIENAAAEPHVSDLAGVLQKMGARISGEGTNRLEIEGRQELAGFDHHIVADHIEAGTFAIAAAATGGDLRIVNARKEHLIITNHYLSRMGVKLSYPEPEILQVKPGNMVSTVDKIQVGLWPGFPTDLMSPMIVLATQTRGTTLCHDWMYESRMFFVDKLIVMGANITQCDPHRVLVSGPTRLRGQKLSSPDIRAGIALVIAAMAAGGQSTIEQAGLVDRGYEDIARRFNRIGAKITRQD